MQSCGEFELLRVFVGESDKHQGKSVVELIVHEAHRRGISGATVIHGSMGFGAGSHIHTSKVLRLSEDLPVIIEIIDQSEKITDFLQYLNEVLEGGIATVEKVKLFKK